MNTKLRSWMMVLIALLALSCGLLTGDDDEPAPPTPTSAGQPKEATATPLPVATLTQPAESKEGTPQLLVSLPGGAREILHVAGNTVWVALSDVDAVLVDLTTGEEHTAAVGTLVGVDDNGRSWLVSQDGSAISMWNGNDWITYSENAGWTPIGGTTFYPPVNANLVTDATGQVWLATRADVRSFDGNRWQVHSLAAMGMAPPEEEMLMEFTLLFAESANEMWVGECTWGGPGPFGGEGVRRFD
ncbi:MAG: hypothetical protein ACP5GX_10120, partial [Anaerolineae bacterium]